MLTPKYAFFSLYMQETMLAIEIRFKNDVKKQQDAEEIISKVMPIIIGLPREKERESIGQKD